MVVKIELPTNKKELSFTLEVLKRLGIKILSEEQDDSLSKEVAEEHRTILQERRKAMSAPDAKFYSWEEAQEIIAQRRTKK
ncbi:MAG: hypothetical protein AAGJ18_12955 [Bacteroidota bacterium]